MSNSQIAQSDGEATLEQVGQASQPVDQTGFDLHRLGPGRDGHESTVEIEEQRVPARIGQGRRWQARFWWRRGHNPNAYAARVGAGSSIPSQMQQARWGCNEPGSCAATVRRDCPATADMRGDGHDGTGRPHGARMTTNWDRTGARRVQQETPGLARPDGGGRTRNTARGH